MPHHRPHHHIPTLAALTLAILLLPGSGRSQTHTALRPMPVEEYSTNDNIHAAVGATNGVRLGMMVFPHRQFGWEASAGYMKLVSDATQPGGADITTDALALTLGGSYLTHPENTISGMVTILATRIIARRAVEYLDQSRWAGALCFGALYHLDRSWMLFFRAGPSVHILSSSESGAAQTFLHFDGGVCWTW